MIYLQQHVKDIGLKAPFDHLIPLVEFSMSTHTEPAVGSQIHGAPTQVKIWFTEKLEPALSKIQVFDTSGGKVDKRDVKIDQSNGALLIVSLPSLQVQEGVPSGRPSDIACFISGLSSLTSKLRPAPMPILSNRAILSHRDWWAELKPKVEFVEELQRCFLFLR